MTTTETVPAPASSPREAEAQTRWSRWSDRLNPIVVREVQQALTGRAFLLSVLAAAIVVVSIALSVAADFRPASSGRNAFDAGLATLVPLLIFIVPMQAYQSMRHELRGGIVEQLLLSQLRPGRIVMGKLTAAMVQFVLYVSVLSPLLAASYLLRGVDLPMIGISLMFALVFCVTATAFAISSAAQGMLPALQGIANLAVAVGLALASMALIGFIASGQYARGVPLLLNSNDVPMVVSAIVLAGVASCVMSGLTAASFLAHAYENRSTGFRIFLLVIVAVTFGWIVTFVASSHRVEVAAAATISLLIGGSVYGVFMVTEQATLSPRVMAHVPKNPLLAAMATPFLPGRDRGLLCYLLFLGVTVGIGLMFLGHGRVPTEAWRLGAFIIGYGIIYLSLGRWIRGRMPASLQGNHLSRFALPFLLFLCCIVPVLVDAFVQGGVRGWHVGHFMNPFWTIERFAFRGSGNDMLAAVLVVAGVVLLFQVPSMVMAFHEVSQASARRRALTPAVSDRGVA